MRKAEDYLIPHFNHIERQNSVLEVERRESLNIFLFFSKLVQAALTTLEIKSSQLKPLLCILGEFINPELHVQGSAEHKLCCWHLSQGKLCWDSKLQGRRVSREEEYLGQYCPALGSDKHSEGEKVSTAFRKQAIPSFWRTLFTWTRETA